MPRASLSVYLNKFVGESGFMCRAANISEDAIYFARLLEPEREGTSISLEFALPGDDEVLWAHGTVVRDGDHNACDAMAVRFTVLPDTYRSRIARYVERANAGSA